MIEQPLVLRGFAGTIEITSEAKARKAELIAAGKEVARVTTEEEESIALAAFRGLKAYRVEQEASRKAIKAPVLQLGKEIDNVAAADLVDAEREEKRLEGLVNHFQQIRARERIEAERKAEAERQRILKEQEDARLAQERAEQARIDAELAAQRAEAAKGKAKELADAKAKALADEAKRLEDAAFEKSLELETAPQPIVPVFEQPKGVTHKEVLDYHVNGRNEFEQHDNLVKFAAAHPRLVKIEIKRRDLLDELAAGRITEAPGITITSNSKTNIR